MISRLQQTMIWLLVAVLIIGSWQYLGEHSMMVRLFTSSPTRIITFALARYHDILGATFITATEAVVGLVLAFGTAFGLMLGCLAFPRTLKVILPVALLFQVTPLIALAPFLIMLFGIGLLSKFVMAALVAFFPVFVAFAHGVSQVPLAARELFEMNNASRASIIRFLEVPLSMPHILAGTKIAASLSVIGAIVAEFTGAESGLGKNLFIASRRLEPELMMCSIGLSTMLGIALYAAVSFLERRLIFWRN
jgi:NitT/TauT family transport system permease protein